MSLTQEMRDLFDERTDFGDSVELKFTKLVIQKAQKELGEDKSKAEKNPEAEQFLRSVIDALAQVTPSEANIIFTKSFFGDATFRYTKERFSAEKKTSVFDAEVSIRKKEYAQITSDIEQASSLTFVTGTIEEISMILSTQILGREQYYFECWSSARPKLKNLFYPNTFHFSLEYELVLAQKVPEDIPTSKRAVRTRYFHEINEIKYKETTNSIEGLISIPLPYIVWTNEQIKALEKEAIEYRRQIRNKFAWGDSGILRFEKDYVPVYVAAKKLEEQIAYALHCRGKS